MHRLPRRDRHAPLVAAVIAGLLLGLCLPALAMAHATLVVSTPADGEVLTTVPAEVVLTFDEPITAATSSFAVLNGGGATIASGIPDPKDAATLRGSLPRLGPGTYEVQWTVGSADGDIARGTYKFSVAAATPPPPSDTPTATERATAVPSASAVPTAATSVAPTTAPSAAGNGSGSGNGADVLIPIVVVGLLVGGGLAFMLRRRGRE